MAERTLGGPQLAALLPGAAEARPAYRHLARAIGDLVLDGRIALRVRLPAERELAVALGVSRPTVTAAYDLLRDSGYAHSRRGSGTWTALPAGRAPSGVTRALAPPDTAIDLARAAPSPPEQAVTAALAAVAPHVAEHTRSPGYHPYGLPELRAAVAERFTRRGLATVPEQILVTSGAQHALTLVLGLLSTPGDRVLVESPSYPNALEALRRSRLRPVSAPVTDDGWDAGLVESTLRQAVPQLAYLIPDFHNPTGLLMPDDTRARVLRAAHRCGTWLVVDETLTDLALDVPAPLPCAAHAAPGASAQVITVGSMSKSHWGGLRVGWLRAPARLVTELAAQRVAHDLGGPVVDQLLALHFLEKAEVPERVARLRERRDALTGALAAHLPEWTWRQPPGGLSLWVDLGAPVAAALAERALDYGVRIEGGACFAADPGVFEQRLRLPFAAAPDVLREAVRRLAAALADDRPLPSAAHRPRWIV
ncbi:PLP-dependent aminotransferase family protein [Streptomyces spectabilis]|uniref:DNA-binding transcriptional MocR family regulator n=1 Tax=Streptomyces spectabilis TaxID=68270 RepID=A0A5P2XE16_STRST|nr:PLP-dependent aminotransferase family protein [Streptomyces spectabilis]MBB5106582.1 DNA-binding transcriptional MocR family regulator [Streptomyces spectabilis]MCI3903561.1 PLP-dependent aminotransferase family protein [Streptomyces spectabilis]QEV60756.1 PLP-dependent aminotransferase family protein [Streptomyces spectabilis]GGV48164.1 GntR family transcriptional regulator [Streptomyces spectabilis]